MKGLHNMLFMVAVIINPYVQVYLRDTRRNAMIPWMCCEVAKEQLGSRSLKWPC